MLTRDLVSPLPRAECVARIAAMTRYESSTLTGSVTERSFRVGWRYQPCHGAQMRNSFKPYLFGKLRDFDGGTIVHCHFTLHLWVLVFTCCFAVGAAVAVIAAHDWTFISFMLLLIVLGTAISWAERELIMDQVTAAIGARPLTGDGAGGR